MRRWRLDRDALDESRLRLFPHAMVDGHGLPRSPIKGVGRSFTVACRDEIGAQLNFGLGRPISLRYNPWRRRMPGRSPNGGLTGTLR